MFKLVDAIKVTRDVVIEVPTETAIEERKVSMTFMLFPATALENKSWHEMVIGWNAEHITREGPEGQAIPMPYSRENLEELMQRPWFARSVMNAYTKANMGLLEKN